MPDWTIKTLLTWTEGYFDDRGIDSPRLTAEILLAHVLSMRRLDLYLQHDRPLEAGELAGFKAVIKRRVSREPVAYITGEKGFFNDTFKVGKGVLIPRPDTETLVEAVVSRLRKKSLDTNETGPGARVIELGVGSGAIIVSVAAACPGHFFFGCDLSFEAVKTAKANAERIAPGQVWLFRGSWLEAVGKDAGFDLILSNPPYVRSKDMAGLAPEIKAYEPDLALDGGPDGLGAFREILTQAGVMLLPEGELILEMGFDQKAEMTELAGQFPWVRDIGFVKDLAGHNRLAILKK